MCINLSDLRDGCLPKVGLHKMFAAFSYTQSLSCCANEIATEQESLHLVSYHQEVVTVFHGRYALCCMLALEIDMRGNVG